MASHERPTAGEVEERTAAGAIVDGRRIRGLIPYNTESRDLGGWREVIEPAAFHGTDLSELRAVIDHAGVPLGRYPTTLDVEDSDEGLRWALTPPRSRADVVEAVSRGDIRSGSWKMVVARDRWADDVRHVEQISELRDVTLVGAEEPAYPDAQIELRTRPPRKEDTAMAETTVAPAEKAVADNQQEEQRAAPESHPAGSLRAEDRAVSGPGGRGLMEAFRSRGFPGEKATLSWREYEAEARTLTVSAAVNVVNQVDRPGRDFGFDQRYLFPQFASNSVDAGVTSVNVLRQTARTLATAANTVRAVEAVTAKPESSSTVDVVVTAMKQVAGVQTAVPNLYLEQPAIRSVIEQDLRNAINGGLDKLVLDAVATAGFQAPGTDPLLVSIRKAVTTILAAGYQPDTLVLTPANAETLDTLVTGIASGVNDYVFQPGAPSPPVIFGLNKVVSKSIPAATVLDSKAFGQYYMSPVSLARFEEANGTTNSSTVRLELNACFGLERVAAATRIAAA